MSYMNWLAKNPGGTPEQYMDAIRRGVASGQAARQAKIDKFAKEKGITPQRATTGASLYQAIDPLTGRPFSDKRLAKGWEAQRSETGEITGFTPTKAPTTPTMMGTGAGPTGPTPVGEVSSSIAQTSPAPVRRQASGIAEKRRAGLK